jgi:hypothetical protein
MLRTTVKVKRIDYKPIENIVEIELPKETSYYFITGIRKSYKVVPRFKNWEGGDGSIFMYDIIEVGLSFEYIVSAHTLNVCDIPDIYAKPSHKFNKLVICILDNDEEYIRTKEQFDFDFKAVLDKFNDI